MNVGDNYLCYSCGGIGKAVLWRHQYNCQWCHTRGNGTLTDEPIRKPANWSGDVDKPVSTSFFRFFGRHKAQE